MGIPNPFPIFSVLGVEMEYMIVDKNSLTIKPIADTLLAEIAGKITNEVALGEIAISNELVLHVIELKTNGPKQDDGYLCDEFFKVIQQINQLLAAHSSCLMPTAAHPLFNPNDGVKLWPHGNRIIYQTYDRIFNCTGHGWSNLQSTHINLPFAGDKEFSHLHNAIRLILPIIPALTASSPFIEGKRMPALDARLTFYGTNQKKIPLIAGDIIPEFITSHDEYQEKILQPIYKLISPYDEQEILQDEWLNSRGAIARFERSAIEIRIMDIQECPLADLACVHLIVAVLKHIIKNSSDFLQKPIESKQLKHIYDHCIQQGMQTKITDQHFLQQLGINNKSSLTAREIWQALLQTVKQDIPSQRYIDAVNAIIQSGNLAERIIKYCNNDFSSININEVYEKLCHHLANNQPFLYENKIYHQL